MIISICIRNMHNFGASQANNEVLSVSFIDTQRTHDELKYSMSFENWTELIEVNGEKLYLRCMAGESLEGLPKAIALDPKLKQMLSNYSLLLKIKRENYPKNESCELELVGRMKLQLAQFPRTILCTEKLVIFNCYSPIKPNASRILAFDYNGNEVWKIERLDTTAPLNSPYLLDNKWFISDFVGNQYQINIETGEYALDHWSKW